MKEILNNIWNFAKNYVLTGVAIIAILWGVFVKVDSKKDRGTITENKLKAVIEAQETQKILTDTIVVKLSEVSANVIKIMNAQNALKNSYTHYLVNDEALTKEEFLQYMEGLEWDIKSNTVDGYKIGVRKSNKSSSKTPPQ